MLQYDDGSGYVKGMDLQAALTRLNIKIQAYEVREIMRLHSDNNQGINLVEFITVCQFNSVACFYKKKVEV